VNCPAGARETTLGCAAAKNDLDGFCRFRGIFCEAFFYSLEGAEIPLPPDHQAFIQRLLEISFKHVLQGDAMAGPVPGNLVDDPSVEMPLTISGECGILLWKKQEGGSL